MSGLRRLGVGLAVLTLGACSSVPPPSAIPTPLTVSALGERRWDDSRVHTELTQWKRGDGHAAAPGEPLSAAEVLSAALVFRSQWRAELAAVAIARAQTEQARQRMNPMFSLSPERVISAAADSVSPWVVALSLVWPLQTAGKRALAIEQALAQQDNSVLTAAAWVWDTRLAARRALCDAQLAHERMSSDAETLRWYSDLSARLVRQAELGLASRYDAARADLDRLTATQTLRQSELDATNALHALAAVAGLPVEQVQARELGDGCLQLAEHELTAAAGLSADQAIVARLDVRAKLAEFRSVDAAWRAAIAQRTPDVSLGPGYTYDQGDHKLTFAFSTEVPLHHRNQAQIARALADHDRVVAELEALQTSVLQSAAQAADQYRNARRQWQSATAAVRDAEDVVQRDSRRRTAGEVDESTVDLARLTVARARADQLNAAKAVIDAVAALESAVQQPLAEPWFDADAIVRRVGEPNE